MKTWIAVMALGGLVLGSVAMATSTLDNEPVNQALVDAKIDGRLHELLLTARLSQLGR